MLTNKCKPRTTSQVVPLYKSHVGPDITPQQCLICREQTGGQDWLLKGEVIFDHTEITDSFSSKSLNSEDQIWEGAALATLKKQLTITDAALVEPRL